MATQNARSPVAPEVGPLQAHVDVSPAAKGRSAHGDRPRPRVRGLPSSSYETAHDDQVPGRPRVEPGASQTARSLVLAVVGAPKPSISDGEGVLGRLGGLGRGRRSRVTRPPRAGWWVERAFEVAVGGASLRQPAADEASRHRSAGTGAARRDAGRAARPVAQSCARSRVLRSAQKASRSPRIRLSCSGLSRPAALA